MSKKLEFSTLLNYLDQRLPIHELKYFDLEKCSDQQSQNELLRHMNDIVPYNPLYVKNFLKLYISIIESRNEEIIDHLYDFFCSGPVLNAKEKKPTDTDLLAYYTAGNEKENESFNHGKILIKESPRLLSDQGSTGQRTWEASLYLANFLSSNGFDLNNKRVCELGAGTGVVSIGLSKFYRKHGTIKEILATDGDPNFLQKFQEILSLNASQTDIPIKSMRLVWGTTNTNDADFSMVPPEVDVIVASDVTYDSSILIPLCSTILDFFHRGCCTAIIASTIRKTSTINEFDEVLNKYFKHNWKVLSRCDKPTDLKYGCCFQTEAPKMQIYQIDNKRYTNYSNI